MKIPIADTPEYRLTQDSDHLIHPRSPLHEAYPYHDGGAQDRKGHRGGGEERPAHPSPDYRDAAYDGLGEEEVYGDGPSLEEPGQQPCKDDYTDSHAGTKGLEEGELHYSFPDVQPDHA